MIDIDKLLKLTNQAIANRQKAEQEILKRLIISGLSIEEAEKLISRLINSIELLAELN